jgi:hypothetical protein
MAEKRKAKPKGPWTAAEIARNERANRAQVAHDRLDVMQWLSGVDFDDLYAALDPETIDSTVDGIPVRVCGLEHLRAMKRAAGRPEDLKDLERLGEGPQPVAQDTPEG